MIELSELRDAVQKAFPPDPLTPDRDQSWQLAAEMGWLILELSDEQGGLGMGRDASATLHYELGKSLPAVPLIPALLGLQAVAASTCLAGKEEWIKRVSGGEYTPLNMLPGAAVEQNADGTLSGVIPGYFEADMARQVVAASAAGFLLIPTDAGGITLSEHPLWDPSRRIFSLELNNYQPDPALVIANPQDAGELHDLISPSAQLAIASDSLGAANTLLEMTIEYLKTRRQFDRPLAMFQALKHRVADHKTALEAAEALLWSRAGPTSSMEELGALKALCVRTFRDIAEDAIQLHGGIGLTEEHPCHRFFKRAMLNCTLAGDVDHWEGVAGRALLSSS
ncbi:acyl-CoA dehydrogenase family protein [Pontixanthobacter aquaemixtae]|uniref:Acyl-CoA dehydrogenase n=1 Tax=Pontixanthobacter aquaemixtae TaxID=1958940 RepID=A0A844ZT59_9SPHN|nr:acyl-CoA dehydrogenase family protein [Pontixanthobacter aquaemixtae]MXO89997.1 acyl-CoA dehydrogenase [Pontixanthobacter aquaemixtae]